MTVLSDKVSELAEKVGEQNGKLGGLTKLFDRHCDDDDRRHVENVEALKRAHSDNLANFSEVFAELRQINARLGPVIGLADKVEDMRAKLEPMAGLVEDVKEIKPHIESYKTFRIQVGLLVLIVTGTVTGAISLLYLAISHIGDIKEVLAKFLPIK